ncbi:hypothetical protein D3C85_1691300 [compost metagenome]
MLRAGAMDAGATFFELSVGFPGLTTTRRLWVDCDAPLPLRRLASIVSNNLLITRMGLDVSFS